ncbi:MAG TPA: hypothetical protein VGH28_21435 [Polyangiaceae bacterium]|jgi:hypothetical protein
MSMKLSGAAIVAAIAACAAVAACSGSGASVDDGGLDAAVESGPTCGNGQTMCSGICTDTTKDPASCGSCGHACGGTEACQAGKCVSACGAGSTNCSGSCTSTDNDNANCGACGIKCPQGEACTSGKCGTTCPTGEALCSPDGGAAYCATTATDNANCGTCGTKCSQGEVCSAGKCGPTCLPPATSCTPDGGAAYCADTTSDNANCGACGTVCPAHQACSSSACACVPTTPAECNGVDNACDNIVDEGCPTAVGFDTTATPSAISALYGEAGGNAWGPDVCPAGQALVGIGGDDGGNIDRIHGICGTIGINENTQTNPYTYTVTTTAGATLPEHGGNLTTAFSVTCPANQVVTRVDGYYDTVDHTITGGATVGVHQLSVYCSSVTALGQPNSFTLVASTPTLAGTAKSNYNLSQSTAFSFFCPGSDAIGALAGRSGQWTDAIQFECFTPSVTLRP